MEIILSVEILNSFATLNLYSQDIEKHFGLNKGEWNNLEKERKEYYIKKLIRNNLLYDINERDY